MKRLALSAALFSIALASLGIREASAERLSGFRGMTVGPIENSLNPGRGYGSPASEELLDYLVGMGVNWISITPFGRIWSLDSTEILMDFEAPYEENREAIQRFIHAAHARNLKVMLIPHLWVERGGWRGEIDPGSEERWARYLENYRKFVLAWARNASEAGADALSIGVECKSFSGRFPEFWSELIREIRSFYPGLLTYSANWDEIDLVSFWDELDLVGINAFYPLARSQAAATDEDYQKGAARWATRLGEFAQRVEKPILFVEVGYTTRRFAGVDPWTWPEDLPGVMVDEEEQARALRIVLDTFVREPYFAGFFIWRTYASLDDVSQEAPWGFNPLHKKAEADLRAIYRMPYRSDPEPFSLESLLERSPRDRSPLLPLLTRESSDSKRRRRPPSRSRLDLRGPLKDRDPHRRDR